jgi:hypothetical protein
MTGRKVPTPYLLEGIRAKPSKYTNGVGMQVPGFPWGIPVSGLLLGAVTGLLIGLTRNPVAGTAITGLLGAIAALFGLTSGSLNTIRVRWHFFSIFIIPFAASLLLGGIGGAYWRSHQPSPAEALVTQLEQLKVSPTTIVKIVVDAFSKSDNPASFLDTDIFYDFRRPAMPWSHIASPDMEIEPSACKEESLQPPPVGYKELAFLDRFKDAGPPFAGLVDLIEHSVGGGDSNAVSTKLLMLRAGYYGVCGR